MCLTRASLKSFLSYFSDVVNRLCSQAWSELLSNSKFSKSLPFLFLVGLSDPSSLHHLHAIGGVLPLSVTMPSTASPEGVTSVALLKSILEASKTSREPALALVICNEQGVLDLTGFLVLGGKGQQSLGRCTFFTASRTRSSLEHHNQFPWSPICRRVSVQAVIFRAARDIRSTQSAKDWKGQDSCRNCLLLTSVCL